MVRLTHSGSTCNCHQSVFTNHHVYCVCTTIVYRNLIAWSSFTAQNTDRGFLQFYASAQASIIFDKPVLNKGFASAVSQSHLCTSAISTSYSPATAYLDVTVALCDKGHCGNPCPGILAPQAMGYNPLTSLENSMDIKIDMQSVSTALAINMGMTQLNHLVQIPGDSDRLKLLDEMVLQGFLNLSIANHTSSYYGELYMCFTAIYCLSIYG